MKIAINISKKYFFLILAGILILAGVIAVYAYNSGRSPSVFGHSAEELEVNISGSPMTLQYAIDNNLIGGSSSPIGKFGIIYSQNVTISFGGECGYDYPIHDYCPKDMVL